MPRTSPARKRARTQEDIDASSNPAHPNSERVRDEEFWYEDGNIIIVTGNVEFKVIRGILMDHSPIFKDMLSLPQPASCDPSDIPVVPVDDSPQDLRHVFGAIMPKSNSMNTPFGTESPSFHKVSALIRIGQKYDMTTILHHAVAFLKSYYTDDFDIWQKRSGKLVPPGFDDRHVVGVVNLAHFVSEPSILPTAMLACCMLEDIAVGFDREDGTRERLSYDDISRCWIARRRLAEIGMAVTAKISTSPRCEKECRHLMQVNAKSYIIPKTPSPAMDDPFRPRVEIYNHYTQNYEPLCQPCEDSSRPGQLKESRTNWSSLPALTGCSDLLASGWGEPRSA